MLARTPVEHAQPHAAADFVQGALPFLIGDALETVAAAGVLPLAWWAIGEPHDSERDAAA